MIFKGENKKQNDGAISDAGFKTACVLGGAGLIGIGTGYLSALLFKHKFKTKLEFEKLRIEREAAAKKKELEEQYDDKYTVLLNEFLTKEQEMEDQYDKKNKALDKAAEMDVANLEARRSNLAQQAVNLCNVIETITAASTPQDAVEAARYVDMDKIMKAIMEMDD